MKFSMVQPPIRRFKLRARHIRPFTPEWFRLWMATYYKKRMTGYSDTIRAMREAGQLTMEKDIELLNKIRKCQAAFQLWLYGYVMPDAYSDDPVARRKCDNLMTYFNRVEVANSIYPGVRDTIVAIMEHQPVWVKHSSTHTAFKFEYDNTKEKYVALIKPEGNSTLKQIVCDERALAGALIEGTFLPMEDTTAPSPK